ncbi:hypothetical protein MKK69_03210 [Methylobacterium sp. J-026]|nr:hypothetical protein [Methylobacterium sp. J-026]MCJ2133082.1 hypothetical protein [Methylobacterium sp. J-026]
MTAISQSRDLCNAQVLSAEGRDASGMSVRNDERSIFGDGIAVSIALSSD